MKKLFAFIAFSMIFAAGAFAQVDAKIPEGEVQIIDNFENGNYWIWAGFDWDRYGGHKVSVGADLSKQHVSEGKYSMELLLEPFAPGNNAVFFYDGTQDLSGGKYIVADFYNDNTQSVQISFVIQATDNYDWLETPSYMIPHGQHTVVFYVENINRNFNDIKRINVNASFGHTNKNYSSIFIDNIRLIK